MNKTLKILLSIIGFIILLYFYAAIISLILMFPLGLIMRWESTGWVICLIISFLLSPILSFITIKKILYPKENKVINKDVDKMYENEINKK